MLEHLEIKNYALIENLSVDFSDGFNVITGETGAGKSIILGALGLLMGEKADPNSIRTGTEEIVVNAVVSVPEDHEINNYLKENDIEKEDGRIIIRRTVKAGGKSVIKVQNTLVTRTVLSCIADSLIDMHGQSEHQSLLLSDKQRKILDSYAQNNDLLNEISKQCSVIQALKTKKEEIERNIEEAQRTSDYLQFACDEITAVDPKPGEDESLKEKISVISHYESIFENLSVCCESLKESQSKLYDAGVFCQKACKSDSNLSEFCARLESSRIEAEDIAQSIKEYLSNVNYSEESVNLMQERLASIQKLKRKYGSTIEEVLQFLENAHEKLDIAENSKFHLDKCNKELEGALLQYNKVARQLTESRVQHSAVLEKKIEAVLRTLGMPNADFAIEINTDAEKVSPIGQDSIGFMISANPGETRKQMKEIASGGELSRIMLALKTVLAKSDDIQTQVFDEVDSGIGGTVASSLAACIVDLSKSRQVIAITHLASIASKADAQFVVSKTVEGGRTYTHLKKTEGEDRVTEIARMLSGDNTSVSLEHARQLLN